MLVAVCALPAPPAALSRRRLSAQRAPLLDLPGCPLPAARRPPPAANCQPIPGAGAGPRRGPLRVPYGVPYAASALPGAPWRSLTLPD